MAVMGAMDKSERETERQTETQRERERERGTEGEILPAREWSSILSITLQSNTIFISRAAERYFNIADPDPFVEKAKDPIIHETN